jgi:hypothetical protein
VTIWPDNYCQCGFSGQYSFMPLTWTWGCANNECSVVTEGFTACPWAHTRMGDDVIFQTAPVWTSHLWDWTTFWSFLELNPSTNPRNVWETATTDPEDRRRAVAAPTQVVTESVFVDEAEAASKLPRGEEEQSRLAKRDESKETVE